MIEAIKRMFKRESKYIVTVDRIEGEYAVCLMPDMSTKDLKITNLPLIKERDKVEVKVNENDELEFIELKPDLLRVNKKRSPQYVRFR